MHITYPHIHYAVRAEYQIKALTLFSKKEGALYTRPAVVLLGLEDFCVWSVKSPIEERVLNENLSKHIWNIIIKIITQLARNIY